MQFSNIAVVLLFIDFSSNYRIPGLPLLQGQYSDFTPQWFRKVGAALTFTMLLNTVTPHVSKTNKALLTFFIRLYDRGFKRDLKKNRNSPDQEVNTK